MKRTAYLWAALCGMAGAAGPVPESDPVNAIPRLDPRHRHTAQLLTNALAYFHPANDPIEATSGYPREGWNHQPERGLYLRSFTQLTAIGLWLELQAAFAVGDLVDPQWPRARALAGLARTTRSLRHDQRTAGLGDRGLLGNFLGLEPDRRVGPLASEVYRRDLREQFDDVTAQRIWRALAVRGWIAPLRDGEMALIRRGPGYGAAGFDGPLAHFADADSKRRILAVLDRRVAQVVFGDNANLSASVARTIGALRSVPEAQAIAAELEAFLDAQRDGYARLYDPALRRFRFGWNATLEHHLGWANAEGEWTVAYSDYLANEFRGPTQFVITRFDLAADALANLGFQMKGWTLADGRTLHTLAPYDGSAFQSFGLTLSLGERAVPAWRALLENAVDLHLDYARRHRLPGLLSESYSGRGTEYTGRCGVPGLAVAAADRLTHAPSLYTLGIAHALRPQAVEDQLRDRWDDVRKLFTDHGPWEGYDVAHGRPVPFQTAAHTAALILGVLDTADRNLAAYLQGRGLAEAAQRLYPLSPPADLLEEGALCAVEPASAGRRRGRGLVIGAAEAVVRITHPQRDAGLDLSGVELVVSYRHAGADRPAVLRLDRRLGLARLFPMELHMTLRDTGAGSDTLRFPLPATPGLLGVRELIWTFAAGAGDVQIERVESVAVADHQ